MYQKNLFQLLTHFYFRSEPEGNPFSIGRGDLDPLAGGAIGGPGHGGMLMDPRRGGRFQDPSVGLPQRLPRFYLSDFVQFSF